MATILAHLTVREGHEARFEEIARTLHRETHANETGVLRYEYWRGADPRTYYTLLSFTDFPTFIVHQTSDHHEEAAPRLGEVLEGLRLEWIDPIADASPLPSTQDTPVPENAPALAREYGDRYRAQVAAWWLSLR